MNAKHNENDLNHLVDFGYQRVSPDEKTRRVDDVFSSVAFRYDLMNDLMSFGVHRIWKRFCVHVSQLKPDSVILDLACGTGDLSFLMKKSSGKDSRIIMCDVNESMLLNGRDRLYDKGVIDGIDYVIGNAESLPFVNNYFDCVTMAFGLRNVTDKGSALKSMFEKLKYGGAVIILEFSQVLSPILKQLYDNYSFNVIPALGKLITKDPDSYRYLVESIRMHPDQEGLKKMLEDAGFSRVDYLNLSAGIVALHKGYKL